MRRSSLLAVVGLVMLAVLSCGGQALDPEDVTVSIEPSAVVLAPGETQVFTATVEGTTATEVRWSTNGGVLAGGGVSVEYTAPLALGDYVVNVTSVADPAASAEAQIVLEVRGRVSAAEDTVVASGDGSVDVRIPAGAVTDDGDLVLRAVALGEAIDGLDAVIAAVSVTRPEALEQLARLSFVVPAGSLAPGTTYQVYTREDSGSGWRAIPSFNLDGRLAVITPRFSDFVMGVASTASYERRHTLDPAFDADAFAMHFPNDPNHLREVVGDDAVLSHPIFNGICYGMSMTAGDYYASGRPSPLVRSAADDDRFGAVVHGTPPADLVAYASLRQNSQHVEFVARAMQKWFSDPLRRLAIVTEGQRIVESIRRGSPAPVGFGASSDDDPLSELNTGHVVLAYEASEAYDAESDTLRLTLTVYDPNRYTVISGDAPTAYHDPGSITITVSGYEAGKRDPTRLGVDITHRLGWSYDIGVLFMMTPRFDTAALPWSNPSLQGVSVDVAADEVVFVPAWAHPNPGAGIERFAWSVAHVDGGHHLHEFSTPSGGRDEHAIARERLEPGAYVVRAMAQDTRGNWSNAVDAPFSVPEAPPPPPPGALTVTPDTVSGTALEGSSAVGAFELANTGDGPVRIHSIAPDAAWLSVSTSSVETLLPGAVIDVAVTMSAADLAPGMHTGTITVTWSPGSDDATREAAVAVAFTVMAEPEPVEVTIDPPSLTLEAGGSQPFVASVTGASNTSVTWSATCGSVSGSGNTVTYTAEASAGDCDVTARSVVDPGASATATVMVMPSFGRAASYLRFANVRVLPSVGGAREVRFDLGWDESWRGPSRPSWVAASDNWDAVWVFLKYRVDGGAWRHATLAGSGHVAPSGAVVDVPSDRVGAFVYRASSGYGTFDVSDVGLQWDHAADGVAAGARVQLVPFGIEMVYVPQGSFSLGSGGGEFGAFRAGGTEGTPFVVTSQSSLQLGDGPGQLMWTYIADTAMGYPEGSTHASFPTGFGAFYVMKYQVTQGQYVDFLNTLTQVQADARRLTAFSNRYWIYGPGVGLYATGAPFVTINFMSWADGAAFADWAGLRPMTELEFEKAARGPLAPVANEYAWGSTSITPLTGLANSESMVEAPLPAGANANYSTASPHVIEGPVRAGSFAAPGRSRRDAGAGYYGALELSGNLWERPVTVGEPQGRAFAGTHGDGVLDASGNANVASWPGVDSIGAGFRGGGWWNTEGALRSSSRASAAGIVEGRSNMYGWRGARTAP